MEDIEKLVKAARAQIDCDRFYKENNDCAGCEMPYKENPSYQKMCVGFDLFVLPKIVDALESLKNSNEVLRAERDELHKNNCGLRGENTGLRAELAASQRREQAAVKEAKNMTLDAIYNFVMEEMSTHTLNESLILQLVLNRIYRIRREWRGLGAEEGEAE